MTGLALEVRFEPLSANSLSRAGQMTQRTNQFNFTTVRRTEQELNSVLDEGYQCVTVDVSDRFGAYGIVGLLIWRESERILDVDTFLLSCRALGRGVEHRMLSFLAARAAERGLTAVRVRAVPTGKNRPARQFIRDVAAAYEQDDGSGFQYDLPAGEFRDLQWRAASRPTAARVAKPLRLDARRFVEYAHIARDLSAPARIVAAMRQPFRGRQSRRSDDCRSAQAGGDLVGPPSQTGDRPGRQLLRLGRAFPAGRSAACACARSSELNSLSMTFIRRG